MFEGVTLRACGGWFAAVLAAWTTVAFGKPWLLGSGRSANQRGTSVGTLTVRARGLESERGYVVGKLFRKVDDVPKGRAFRRVRVRAKSPQVVLQWPDLPYGLYALFLFHDQNSNGVPDHNWLGIPTEPMGFSAGFRPSIWTGIPDFDDLRFEFSQGAPAQQIVLE